MRTFRIITIVVSIFGIVECIALLVIWSGGLNGTPFCESSSFGGSTGSMGPHPLSVFGILVDSLVAFLLSLAKIGFFFLHLAVLFCAPLMFLSLKAHDSKPPTHSMWLVWVISALVIQVCGAVVIGVSC